MFFISLRKRLLRPKVITKVKEVEVEVEKKVEVEVDKIIYKKIEVPTPYEVTKYVAIPVPTEAKDLPSAPQIGSKELDKIAQIGGAVWAVKFMILPQWMII